VNHTVNIFSDLTTL